MLRRRDRIRKVRISPELDDRDLRRALAEIRPSHQLHGLGADRTHAAWQPIADLPRATGSDWDRRTHRICVLARTLPPAVADRWATARPESPDAAVVQAHVLAGRAPEHGREAAARAEKLCLRAAEACPADPAPWIALLSLLRAMGIPVRHARPVWNEIAARDPTNRCAHHELLRYISPRECGSLIGMDEFARSAAETAPHGSPLAMLPLAARTEHYAHRLRPDSPDTIGAGTHWHGPHVAKEIDTALTRWFDTPAAPHAQAMADLNLLAFALTRTQRLPEAARAFRRIGRHMTLYPWDLVPDPVDTFLYWRDRGRT
ncbi:hypothetical protein [Streptomyces coffeae]|uniref:DUF4034 domain-containing protein n=1 Tax=Streptomyces coffeae TaxID=621382 RepID=A0ABS1NR21_9ACTN|nr:hypothetical protein [Streptomyces coffeae]MBL1102390.1 hypothetical protein [Streptomyces coffeae]